MCQWPLPGDGGVPTLFGFTSTTKPSTDTFTCSYDDEPEYEEPAEPLPS